MTCIVGLIHKGKTYLGGDAAGSDSSSGDIGVRLEPKVFNRNEYLFGYTSSFRMGGILELIVPAPGPKPADVSLRQHLIQSWISTLRRVFKEEGYMAIDKSQEAGGTFLVGYHGELCVIYSDFQVGTPHNNYSSIGSGSMYALGSLFTTAHIRKISPNRRVTLALKASAAHNAFVRPPFTILNS